MGSIYAFRCEGCGYGADVSGGPDVGFVLRTRTVYCPACRSLSDVPTGPACEGAPDAADLDARSFDRCGTCGGTALSPWTRDDPCPRCGGLMADHGLVTLWD
jgi:hypothetical protein